LDLVVFVVFTLGLTLLNWGVRLLVVAPLARVLLHGPKKEVRTLVAMVDPPLMYSPDQKDGGLKPCFLMAVVSSTPERTRHQPTN
jgi:hypothetical protein